MWRKLCKTEHFKTKFLYWPTRPQLNRWSLFSRMASMWTSVRLSVFPYICHKTKTRCYTIIDARAPENNIHAATGTMCEDNGCGQVGHLEFARLVFILFTEDVLSLWKCGFLAFSLQLFALDISFQFLLLSVKIAIRHIWRSTCKSRFRIIQIIGNLWTECQMPQEWVFILLFWYWHEEDIIVIV